HHAGTEVRHEVAVEVAHHEHIKLLWPRHHLHAAVVHDDLFCLDLGEIASSGAEGVEEQTIGKFEDIRLVDAVDDLAAVRPRPLEGETEETPAGGFGDDLQALHAAADHLMFDGTVQVL